MNDRDKAIVHFGILGMHWGHRKGNAQTDAIKARANKVLNNPKSSKAEVDKALADIGVDPKTGKSMRTKPVYDKKGNDISVNPITRVLRKDGQSDKDFDAELKGETSPNEVAKQKVEDLKIDREAKANTVAMLATVGVILAVKYVAMKQISKAADASILAKYGPAFFELYKNSGH